VSARPLTAGSGCPEDVALGGFRVDHPPLGDPLVLDPQEVSGKVVEFAAATLGVDLDHQQHPVRSHLHRRLGQLDPKARRRKVHRLDPTEVLLAPVEPRHCPVGAGHQATRSGAKSSRIPSKSAAEKAAMKRSAVLRIGIARHPPTGPSVSEGQR